MRNHPTLALLASLTLTLAAPTAPAQTVAAASFARPGAIDHQDRAGAQAAAERGLADYIERKQRRAGSSQSAALALDGAAELGRARIAAGFEVHTIAPADLLAGRAELRQMAQASGIWRFFVKVGARPVGLVTVQRMEGRWQAVSFGGAQLAAELAPLMDVHGEAGAGRLRFIRVHQAQTDLLEVVSPRDLQARYALLASARHALGSELRGAAPAALGATAEPPRAALLDTYELLEPLRAAVKRHAAATQP